MAEQHHARAASCLHTSQSSLGTSSSRRLDAVTGLPATPYRSLSPTGIPVRSGAGPSRRTPAALRRSSARDGGRDRILLVDPDPRVDRLGIAFVAVDTVAVTDPRQAGRDELGRRGAALGEQRRRVDDSESSQVVHASTSTSHVGNQHGAAR